MSLSEIPTLLEALRKELQRRFGVKGKQPATFPKDFAKVIQRSLGAG